MKILYYIVYGLFYLISLLPWRVVYIISDTLYLLIYYIIGYRKDVVINNLKIAFPKKTEEERITIAKDFYKNFIDNFIEVIKLISISEKELSKRFTADYKIINDLYSTGKNVYLVLGHFFNWEFANLAYSKNVVYPLVVVYMPIKNKVFDRIFHKVRTKFGALLVAATNFRNQFRVYAKQRFVLALVGDQNPGNPDNAYWTNFFGKPTPFVKGPEKGARGNDVAIVMVNFYRTKRGFYTAENKLLTTNPRSLREGEITKQMIAFIEECIHKNPSNYLWSHKRWKWQYDEARHRKLVI